MALLKRGVGEFNCLHPHKRTNVAIRASLRLPDSSAREAGEILEMAEA